MTKKTKEFVRKVGTTSDYDEVPAYIKVEVTKGLAGVIRKAQKAIKAQDAYSMEFFDYSPTWLNADPNDPDKTGDDFDGSMDLSCLVVTNDSFHWSANLKHSSVVVESEEIKIDELEGL